MARMEIIKDDIDGSEDAVTITFSLNGDEREIDLTEKNRTLLEKALKKYIDHSRPRAVVHAQPGRRGRRTTVTSTSNRETMQAMREWARKEGMKISDRGRVPQTIQDAWYLAHATEKQFSHA